MAKKLTTKQSVFIDEYMVDFNATQAAIRAGYSKKTACSIGLENLGKPLIQAGLAKRLAVRAAKTGIDAEWVQAKLKRNEEATYADGDMVQSTRNIELLGKTCGAFTDQIEKDTTINIIFKRAKEG